MCDCSGCVTTRAAKRSQEALEANARANQLLGVQAQENDKINQQLNDELEAQKQYIRDNLEPMAKENSRLVILQVSLNDQLAKQGEQIRELEVRLKECDDDIKPKKPSHSPNKKG